MWEMPNHQCQRTVGKSHKMYTFGKQVSAVVDDPRNTVCHIRGVVNRGGRSA